MNERIKRKIDRLVEMASSCLGIAMLIGVIGSWVAFAAFMAFKVLKQLVERFGS